MDKSDVYHVHAQHEEMTPNSSDIFLCQPEKLYLIMVQLQDREAPVSLLSEWRYGAHLQQTCSMKSNKVILY